MWGFKDRQEPCLWIIEHRRDQRILFRQVMEDTKVVCGTLSKKAGRNKITGKCKPTALNKNIPVALQLHYSSKNNHRAILPLCHNPACSQGLWHRAATSISSSLPIFHSTQKDLNPLISQGFRSLMQKSNPQAVSTTQTWITTIRFHALRCGRWDLNPHENTPTRFLVLLVCQFRHFRASGISCIQHFLPTSDNIPQFFKISNTFFYIFAKIFK